MRADMEKYIAERLIEKYFVEPANEKPVKPAKPAKPGKAAKAEKTR